MKPIYLEMENIGPFVKRTKVDFSEIEEGGLFLVSGPTGSGKSFIFDTICYALFGKTPSGREGHLKSDYAGIGDEPTIRFAFQVGSSEYLVERTLEHEDHARRGDGITTRKEEAVLSKIVTDGSGNEREEPLATKKSDVQTASEEILGLEMEQFSRVMMIPQGEFRELLRADTDKREKLLRKLFDSRFFWDVSDELSKRYGKLSKELNEARTRNETKIGTIVNKLGLDSGPGEGLTFDEWAVDVLEKLKNDLSKQKETEKKAEKELKEFQKQLETCRDAFNTDQALSEVKNKLAEMEKRKTEEIRPMEKRLELSGRAGHLRGELGRLEELEKTKDQLVKELKVKEKALKDKKGRFGTIKKVNEEKGPKVDQELESLKEDLGTLKRARPKVEEMDDLRSEMKPLDQEIKKMEKELDGISKRKKELEDECKGIIEEIRKIPVQGELMKRIALVRKNGCDLISILEQKEKKENKLEDLRSKKDEKEKEVRIEEEVLKDLRRRREETIAGELAASLKTGVECPVCGSIDHPHPRETTEDDVSQDMIRKAEGALEKIRKHYLELDREVTQVQTKVEELKARSHQIVSENRELDLAPDDLKKKVHELREEERSIEISQERREALEKTKENIETEEKKSRTSESRIRESLSTKRTRFEVMCGRFEEKRALLKELRLDEEGPLGSLDKRTVELEKRTEELSEWKERVKGQLEASRDAFNKAEQDHLSCNERLKNSKENGERARDELIVKIQAIEGIASLEGLRKAVLEREQEEKIKGVIDRFNKDRSGLMGQAQSYIKKLETFEIDIPDREGLKELEKTVENASSVWKEVHRRSSNVEKDLEWTDGELTTIKDSREDMGAKEEEISIVGKLALQVKGNGVPRISLERFFLAQRFEEVLIASNQRLKVLSGNRFLLKRSEVKGKRSKGGLDIDVYDNHTGQERPAKTLSGGQMFLSSLALALGLADVVQSRSGGIKMDALFIDEGFGSLDEETLQTALKVLSELRQGRTVGVISHVGELKRQIRSGYEVIPSREGSSIRAIG